MIKSGRFPVRDITHKSRRTQQGNLAAAGVLDDEASSSSTDVFVAPKALTLEKAIRFYETNAPKQDSSEMRTLYSSTAQWLKEYMTTPRTQKEVQHVSQSDEY